MEGFLQHRKLSPHMAEENNPTHKDSACSVEVSPSEVDAGSDMTLKGKITHSPAKDLRGEALLIMDQNGVSIERVGLTEFDGKINETKEFIVEAPLKPGTYTWLAVHQAHAAGGILHDGASTPFSFIVKPHSTRVVVWDVPSAIECDENFVIKLGVKCSSECRSDGWLAEIHDQDEKQQATTRVDGERWPGTAALYYTEVHLTAPNTKGLYAWKATARLDDSDAPHTECTARFGVRVVAKPDCLVRVVAVDMESQIPVEGAKVVVHPYKAFTDERGVAEVRVQEGEYRLFVSGKDYFPFRSDGKVETSVTIRAELVLDAGPSDADVWS